MTDRSVIKDRQQGCIHQFPIKAPHSEQQPGACERCNLPWAELSDRQREVFSGGRYGRTPHADDARLAEIRDQIRLALHQADGFTDGLAALEPHDYQDAADTIIGGVVQPLLARVDQLTAERDQAMREAEEDRLALLHQPVLRHCVYPACLREFDLGASMDGRPVRESWSSKGWLQATALSGHICPAHASVVAEDAHLPHWQHEHPSHLVCACGWDSGPVRWRGLGIEAWKDHVLPEIKEAPDA